MIQKKTVLVLGAGASQPYRFPTGSELVQRMREYAESPGPEYFRTLSVPVRGDTALGELAEQLKIARPNSIDEFLEHRQDLADAGKTLIAILLLHAEKASEQHLWGNATEGDWYSFLKGQLVGAFDSLGQDQVRIVTFNYDRSLEHYLYQSLRPYYQAKDDRDYGRKISQIRFLHIYGSLGLLPWQSPGKAVPYGAPASVPKHVINARGNIKTLDEGDDGEVQRHIAEAREWLRWAERILFLGFGFHPASVERLALAAVLRPDQDIRATCKGLDRTSRDAVEFCTSWAYRPSNTSGCVAIQFPDVDADCYGFLHDHAVLS